MGNATPNACEAVNANRGTLVGSLAARHGAMVGGLAARHGAVVFPDIALFGCLRVFVITLFRAACQGYQRGAWAAPIASCEQRNDAEVNVCACRERLPKLTWQVG